MDCESKPENVVTSKALEPTYDLLPIFEKDASDRLTRQQNSLLNNHLLNSDWQLYKDTFSQRVFKPFEFPEVTDYHFYIYHNRLLPKESIKSRKDFKMKLRPGPGVDFQGQIPIPNELHLKKGSSNIKPHESKRKGSPFLLDRKKKANNLNKTK